MSTKAFSTLLSSLLEQNRKVLNDDWTSHIMETMGSKYPGILSRDVIQQHANLYITELSAYFKEWNEDMSSLQAGSRLGDMVCALSADHAKRGIKPMDTALYIVAVKRTITKQLTISLADSPEHSIGCSNVLGLLLDQLTLLSFDSYTSAREKVISQQSQSLLELSTPVILLWNNVLLLPLVGVIDTIRARQFTERMLEAITRYEGVVTIIDVTGVPVFDTGVARHIMKAVDAAQLLGSKIVMTGISPEGAQTLTKLNISFSNVISRVSLRAGVAEALKMVGRRIETISY